MNGLQLLRRQIPAVVVRFKNNRFSCLLRNLNQCSSAIQEWVTNLRTKEREWNGQMDSRRKEFEATHFTNSNFKIFCLSHQILPLQPETTGARRKNLDNIGDQHLQCVAAHSEVDRWTDETLTLAMTPPWLGFEPRPLWASDTISKDRDATEPPNHSLYTFLPVLRFLRRIGYKREGSKLNLLVKKISCRPA